MTRSRLAVLIAVLAVAIVAVPVVRWAAARDSTGRRADGGRLPVLLVPGYGGSRASLEQLRATLARRRIQARTIAVPGNGTGDLRASARALATAVERTGPGPVDLIGYSAGGVIARIYVGELGGAARVRHVVLLGAPNHGTKVAELAVQFRAAECAVACTQLAPGSALLDAINGDETPDGPDYLSLWTAKDETVTPPDTARLDGAYNVELQSICPDAATTHGELPRDRLVTGLVLRALEGGPLEGLGEGDCGTLRAAG
jgi:triacylglycerol lipase